MVMYIYIKFAGLNYMEEIMAEVIDNAKCRVNEEEVMIIDPDIGRNGSWKLINSSDHT